MPRIIAIENSESQRRQLSETLTSLAKKGWPLTAKYEAQKFGTWNALFENAITPGLFAQREAIVIEEAETLGEFPVQLSSLIENDKADCVMILMFSTDTKNIKTIADKIKIIKPEAQIPTWSRKTWLINLAKEEGFKLSPDASQLLVDTIESQEELRSEIHKLALYSNGREINISDVEDLSFDEGGKAQLIFLDGVCDNKPSDVSRSLKYLRNSPLPVILTAITNRLRPALMMSCFSDSDKAVKTTGARDYAVRKARAALKIFGENAIKKFMAKAIRLSLLEKTSHSESWQGFELILWELMTENLV